MGEDKLDWIMVEDIKEAFQESDLPFRVDILDWNAISPGQAPYLTVLNVILEQPVDR